MELDSGQDSQAPGAPETSSDGPASTNEGPGIFVAVGYGGRRLRSTDYGVSWTDDVQIEANGADDADNLRTVIWGNQTFVAIGNRTMTSPDGKTWKDDGINAINQWMGAIVYAQGQYVGLGGNGLRATSPDAVAWQDHTVDYIATHAPDGLVFVADDGGRFVGANDNGLRSYSTDGKTWAYSTGVTATTTTELAFGNGRIVSLGGTSVVISTDGGMTWSPGASLGSTCQGLVFAQGHFTALADGHVFTSTDGQTWADHAASSVTASPIAYGHGTYITLGPSKPSRSTDGMTWDPPVTISGTNGLNWVTFGPTGD